MKVIADNLIKFYRWSSLDELGYVFFGSSYGCRFYPSCSHYTQESINKSGFIKGSVKGFFRILKCNPFNKGGIDLP